MIRGTEKEDIQALLRQGICEVVFTKKDGSERQMNCTLDQTFLPLVDQESTGTATGEHEGLVTVWDTDAEGGRRIILENIIYGPKLLTGE